MNTKSEDVVKNVELNQVESTSNEQRQTVKPIVISRRRLLRAGVAGIPVVLTMAGLAPAESIQTTPSAASGLVYGGNKVYNRFYDQRRSDGLVWTDHNGFVLLPEGGVKTSNPALSITTDDSTTGVESFEPTITYIGTAPEESRPSPLTCTASITPPSNLSSNAYMHKTGNWYTDLVVNSSKDLVEYIKDLTLTIKIGDEAIAPTNVDVQDPTFTQNNQWYNKPFMGWNLVNTEDEEEYYALDQSQNTIDSIQFKATLSFSVTKGDYTYSCSDLLITIPLKLVVGNIPAPTADDHGI